MDGLLVVNKPTGPTSHDVVARVRRALGEPRVGHTGTLDPAACGVLPLLIGRATRLAQFLSAAGKSYEAVVRLGVDTDSYDAVGRVVGAPYEGPYPAVAEIDRALDQFRGEVLQQPPAFSAKKIDGERSYRIARAQRKGAAALPAPPVLPDPVRVTAHAIEILGLDGASVRLRVDCSAGFYVRSLAYDLGKALKTGAHLASLKRIRSGAFILNDAIDLETIEQNPEGAAGRLIPLAGILPDLSSVVLTPEGVRRAAHGRDLGAAEGVVGSIFRRPPHSPPGSLGPSGEIPPDPFFVRLLDQEGRLIGIAEPAARPGLLHPSVILM
jgi:tRNA pseudouridine55 synthase